MGVPRITVLFGIGVDEPRNAESSRGNERRSLWGGQSSERCRDIQHLGLGRLRPPSTGVVSTEAGPLEPGSEWIQVSIYFVTSVCRVQPSSSAPQFAPDS